MTQVYLTPAHRSCSRDISAASGWLQQRPRHKDPVLMFKPLEPESAVPLDISVGDIYGNCEETMTMNPDAD